MSVPSFTRELFSSGVNSNYYSNQMLEAQRSYNNDHYYFSPTVSAVSLVAQLPTISLLNFLLALTLGWI
jgi:hypothetical protein